jgi:hypothetical protein
MPKGSLNDSMNQELHAVTDAIPTVGWPVAGLMSRAWLAGWSCMRMTATLESVEGDAK